MENYMELQSLRTFQAAVEEDGILSASRKLNTVQFNVTARIKRLEALSRNRLAGHRIVEHPEFRCVG
jgi:DNA-binding transcriptional LysR family regulator